MVQNATDQPEKSALYLLSHSVFLCHKCFSLCRFGVRPLPKRQMILKLKEIHQYTHQLVSSDSEDEAACVGQTVQVKTTSALAASRPVTCGQKVKFKEPRAPAAVSPVKHGGAEEEGELLSASQGSNTSSTAASEESERYALEYC